MLQNEESQWRVVKMKGGVPWPISLCKLEAGSSSTEIERRAWSRAKSPDVSRAEVEGNIRTLGKTELTSFPRDHTLSALLCN